MRNQTHRNMSAEVWPGNDFYLNDIPTSEQVEANDIPKRFYRVAELAKELHTRRENVYNMVRIAGFGELKPSGKQLSLSEVDFLKRWFEMMMAGETMKGAYHKLKSA